MSNHYNQYYYFYSTVVKIIIADLYQLYLLNSEIIIKIDNDYKR